MPPQDAPVVRCESEFAALLADLVSIRSDLLQTEQLCERLLDFLRTRSPNQDPLIVDALWGAALVRYARCFTTGKRVRLDPAILSHLPGDPIGTHNYYKNQRDKLIAHSVNAFEEVQIGIILSSPAESVRSVIGVANFHARLISGDEQGVKQLGQLAQALRAAVEKQIAEGTQKVLEEARQSSIDELYRLRPMVYTAPGPDAASKARK